LESEDGYISYPVLLRLLAELPFANGTSAKWDAVTPDFTGPRICGNSSALAAAFPARRDALFEREGVVAEFAHLHPWSSASTILSEGLEYNRDIVWVDVTLEPEILWREQFAACCRKNINRAGREGVRVFVGSSDDHVREFYRIYRATMERNGALASYYFSFEFFRAFRDELSEHSRFVLAEFNQRIVAATLYLHDDDNVVSYLGGADAACQHVRPTNAVIWDTIRWAHGMGKKRLILGAGYRPDDGVFRFKSTFSRLRQAFYVYKRIHLPAEYALLERSFRQFSGVAAADIAYFPVYRDRAVASARVA
jgi:CelD/BcsL family acetyltransferase involved in cellulose biosynthesis